MRTKLLLKIFMMNMIVKDTLVKNIILVFSSAHPAQVKAMYGQYRKLGDKQEYGYIREELSEAADTCPYCGFGEPVTLDHYMPESIYKELATCRLNLVPICWKCNNKKLDNDYQGFHMFIIRISQKVVFFYNVRSLLMLVD